MSSPQAGTLSPAVVHPPTGVLLPKVLSERGSVAKGGLFSCGTTAWLVLEDCLAIVDAGTGKTIQTWLPPPEAGTITHVAELSLGPRQQLLVVVLERNDCSVLAVLSQHATKLLRAVEVPEPVTSVHPFCGSNHAPFVDDYYLPDLFQDSVLSYFSGLVAVGCHGGNVYLINLHLNLDDHFCQRFDEECSFSKLSVVGDDSSLDEVQNIGESGMHTCVQITRECYSRGNFIYQKRPFNPRSVRVTALHLISQIRSLCVGYSFGGFHIYGLSPLMLICSAPLMLHAPSVPVTHFAYMEPENDPRSFVYLWVARGRSPAVEQSASSETALSLYQMIFTEKVPLPHQPGAVYHNLQSCCLRLECPLTSVHPPANRPSSSHLLKCFTASQLHHRGRGLDDSGEGTRHLDQTVSAFVWVSGREHYVGLFDINQWYQAQMPNTIHWKRSGAHTGVLGCSYFGFYSLKSLTERGAVLAGENHLLDVNMSNLLPFNSISPVPETHTWPTALSFQLTTLSESGIQSCECYGLQKLTLHELDMCRGALYAQPERFFNMCMQAELVLHHWDYATGLLDLNLQRKALLSVLVEWSCPTRVVYAFVESWLSDGGCTPVVTEWLSHKLTELAKEKDTLCECLSEGSTSSPLLSSYWRQLAAIISLLEKILTYASLSDMEEDSVFVSIDELHCKAVTLQRVVEVVQFLASHDLSDDDGDQFSALSQRYHQFRGHGKNRHRLAVDYLSEEVDQSYPPQSIEQFLTVFETPNVLAQHCLMLYLLRDLQHLVGERAPDLASHYTNIQSLPHLCTVFVYALWLLDNKRYQDSIRYLLQIPSDVTPAFEWYHSVIMESLLRAGHYRLALSYTSVFGVQMQLPDEVKAKVSVLVYNRKLNAAHDLLMQYEGADNFEDLFNHFLADNYKAKSLHMITDLPFSELGEKLFIVYLSQHENPVVREILMVYFLSQHRFVEANAIHEDIREMTKNDLDPRAMQKCRQREAMLKGFNSAIPKVVNKSTFHREGVPQGSRVIAEAEGGSLSSVVAKVSVHGGPVSSNAGLIYNTLQSVADNRSSRQVPLTPFRKKVAGAGGDNTVPFLSTPVSVKKARVMTHASSQKLMPAPVATPGPRMVEGTPFASFQAHMLSFRDRVATMLDQSSAGSGLDISDIHTPTAATSSLLSKPLLSVVTPPSILKGSISAKQSGTEGKRIRFAVEIPEVTPFQERSYQRRMPASYTPAAVSSLATTATSMAINTPLPMSDDSDEFESPAESPSQLVQYLHDSSRPPRFVLDEDDEMKVSEEDKPCSSRDQDGRGDDDYFGDDGGDGHRSVDQSLDDDEEDRHRETPQVSDVPTKDKVKSARKSYVPSFEQSSDVPTITTTTIPTPIPTSTTTATATAASTTATTPVSAQPLKRLMEKLTRDSLQITPLKQQSAGSSGAKATPPVHVSSPMAEPARLFSPIPLLSELVESKKEKLMKSLEEAKKRHSANVTAQQPEKQTYFSPTMVKRTADSSESSKVKSTPLGKQYSFSPPTEMHVDQEPTSVTSSEFDSVNTFVFSPPMTRSAARRMREKSEDRPVPLAGQTATRKRGRGRPPKKSTSSTPPPDTQLAPVVLISPPSQQPTPKATATKEEVRRVRKTKYTAAPGGVQTRRSARLLTSKK